jgi:hypothetical protein
MGLVFEEVSDLDNTFIPEGVALTQFPGISARKAFRRVRLAYPCQHAEMMLI